MAGAEPSIQAVDAWNAIEAFFEQGLTDGLPVVPPTDTLVQRSLDAAGLQPDDVVGTVPARSLAIDARTVAVNAVMAGCRPEYLPVVNAVVEALCEPAFNIHGSSVSTGGAAQLVIVNGPIAKELGMNSGVNVLGPGNRANSTIGRAIRLIVINVIGSRPGEVDMSCIGHGGKYSYLLPENETESPWDPLHVEHGFSADESVVTVVSAQGAHQVHGTMSGDASGIPDAIADSMAACGPDFSNFVVVLGPEPASLLAKIGMSKERVKRVLYDKAERTAASLKRAGKIPGGLTADDETTALKVLRDPSAVTLVVAGGLAGRFSAIIPPWGKGDVSAAQSKVVRRPWQTGKEGAR